MYFDLTDEQQMLQAAARDFLASRLSSEKVRALAESEDAFSADLWKEIADLSSAGVKGITRLAVSPRGDRLAFVADGRR